MRTLLLVLGPIAGLLLSTAGCGDGDEFTVSPKSDAGEQDATKEHEPTQPDANDQDTTDGGASIEMDAEAGADGNVEPEAASEAGEETGTDAAACDPGTADCDGESSNGCEVATDTDLDHCGACDHPCDPAANALPSCLSGVCEYTCESGFEDCDDQPGCEADLASNANCGTCGNVCGDQNATASCNAGTCKLTCDEGFVDCNGDASDGCEAELAADSLNCGWCGHDCGGATCSNGTCEPIVLASGQDGALALALDDTHVYFSAGYAETIGRIGKSGGVTETLVTDVIGKQLRMDDTHLYASSGAEWMDGFVRIPVSTPNGQEVLVSGIHGHGYTLDAQRLFWADAQHGEIWAVPKSGGTPTKLASGEPKPYQIAVNATDIFWGTFDANEIRTMPKSGGTPATLVSNSGRPAAFAIDEEQLYWLAPDEIRRVRFDGTEHEVVENDLSGVSAIALDADYVYFMHSTHGYIGALSKTGGPARLYAQGLSRPQSLAVDDQALYFTDFADGTVSRISK